MAAINPIQPIQSIDAATNVKGAAGVGPQKEDAKAEFGNWLEKSLGEVNRMQKASNEATQKLISGESKDIHGAMIAMQKASIAMELTVEVRNKVIAAYDEIKRMQF
jgi:flagellar hook-basal body complex protein FliE